MGAVLKPPPALPRASECNDSGRSAEAPTRAAARPAPAWNGRGGGLALMKPGNYLTG